MRVQPSLFNFAYHGDIWLKNIAETAKDEPWGKDYKALELYLRATFEIAKQQSKVYEDEVQGLAFWKPGYLVNDMSDPLWLVYQKNRNTNKQKWSFKNLQTGICPKSDRSTEEFQIKISPPDFEPSWSLYMDQRNITHIYKDQDNVKRLETVFGEKLAQNKHMIFRTVLGEIELNRKSETVIPQWYAGEYQFLMPLFLTQSDTVELTATLQPNPTLKRYEIRTLLLPHYSYAYARALVKSRAAFANWILLSESELNNAYGEAETEESIG